MKTNAIVSSERIESRIYSVRRLRVMLDADLARLYGVSTKRLNEQVRRNSDRFPEDFMIQLTPEEVRFLRSQFATSNRGRGGRRYLPYAFTEHGAVMLANVLKSRTAVQASIHVVRAFVRLRELLASHKELARKLDEMEKKYDAKFKTVFAAIRELMSAPRNPPRQIGFHRSK